MPTPVKAIPCQGFTFTWGGQTLYDVQQIQVKYQRGMPTARVTRWSPKPGSIDLIGFSAINLPESDYATKKRLTISCPAGTAGGTLTALDRDCVYTDMTIRATANDAVQFAYTFMLLDTVNDVLIEF